MALTNEEMITEIRQKLNIVNKALIDPDKFKEANHDEISEIHQFVTSKDSFSIHTFSFFQKLNANRPSEIQKHPI